jgi:hypothetical protein
VDEHSCTAGDITWTMCRWNYPKCSASYPSDQLLFGFARGAAAAVEILGSLGQIMAVEIKSQCQYSVGIGLPRLVYFEQMSTILGILVAANDHSKYLAKRGLWFHLPLCT